MSEGEVQPLRQRHKGLVYNGLWFVQNGRVKVVSTYGSTSVPAADGPDLEDQARLAFAELLKAR